MSSNEQMSKGVEDGIVEQPGGSRRVRSLDDLSSGFVTTDLSEAIERIARRREAYPDGDWVVNTPGLRPQSNAEHSVDRPGRLGGRRRHGQAKAAQGKTAQGKTAEGGKFKAMMARKHPRPSTTM
ncbi:hypothetical protein MAJ_05366, partial [Metarhizium majus ARSEF 297]